MAITAKLQCGEEVQINGPLLLIADDGSISVSAGLFSCTQGGEFTKIHIDKLREATISRNSLGEVKELMSSELPSVKPAWERLHNHHANNA